MRHSDPELTVPCPACGAARLQPCISRRAVSIHQARRRALEQLTRQADAILRRGGSPPGR